MVTLLEGGRIRSGQQQATQQQHCGGSSQVERPLHNATSRWRQAGWSADRGMHQTLKININTSFDLQCRALPTHTHCCLLGRQLESLSRGSPALRASSSPVRLAQPHRLAARPASQTDCIASCISTLTPPQHNSTTMGALLSIPIFTGAGAIGSYLCSGCMVFMGMLTRTVD